MMRTSTYMLLPRAFSQIAVVSCAFSLCSSAGAATPIGGFITTDTHWAVGGSPYIATSSLLVDSGATLTIDPGVEVRFAATTGLVLVNGTLSARGNNSSSIVFTADQPGDASRWNGIRFGDNTVNATFDGDDNYLSGTIIEYATVEGIGEHDYGSIRIESSSPFIHKSTIQNNHSQGIWAQYAHDLRIVGNQIQNNSSGGDPSDARPGGGIDIRNSAGLLIVDNQIRDNVFAAFGGLNLNGCNNVQILNNIIERNYGRDDGAGFIINGGNNFLVSGNIISDNEGREYGASSIDIEMGNDVEFINNVVSGNKTVAGLAVEYSAGLSLKGNKIVGNVGDGIRFKTNVSNAVLSADAANPTSIFGNGGFQIYNNQFFDVTTDPLAIGNVDARNVWWGTTDMPSIEAGIFDFFDDSFKGIVFIDPITETPDGNFNGDGSIDAADYVLWRKRGGAASSYDVWRAHFGTTSSSAAGSASTIVPEPTSLVLIGLCVLAIDPLGRVAPRTLWLQRRFKWRRF